MSRRIAVVGSTGRLGGPVADLLEAKDIEVVRIARSQGVDVITGAGLDQALAGASVAIDVTSGRSGDQQAAADFFTTATRNVQAAAERAGVGKIVLVSIIGVDRYTVGYSAANLVHEQVGLAGPVPTTILRAAQFHEFVPQLMEWGTHGGVTYVAKMRTQLVAAREVARVVVDLALADGSEADGMIREVAGPQEERLADMARLFADRTGWETTIQEVDDPTDPEGLGAAGALLPGPGAVLGGPTFPAWVDDFVAYPDLAARVRGRLDSART